MHKSYSLLTTLILIALILTPCASAYFEDYTVVTTDVVDGQWPLDVFVVPSRIDRTPAEQESVDQIRSALDKADSEKRSGTVAYDPSKEPTVTVDVMVVYDPEFKNDIDHGWFNDAPGHCRRIMADVSNMFGRDDIKICSVENLVQKRCTDDRKI